MNSKERILNATAHKPTDKIGIDFWSTAETDAKLLKHLGLTDRDRLLEELGVDVAYIEGPAYIGRPLKQYPDGSSDDIWSVTRKTCYAGAGDSRQSYKAVVTSPLAGARAVDEVLSYEHWPNPDDFDYDCIEQQCRDARGKAVFFMGDRLNRIAQLKPAQYLRGMEQILVDSILEADIFEAIITKIRQFYSEYLRRILRTAAGAIDVVVTGDDFGTQHGLMIAQPAWKRYIYPGFAEFIDISHSFGAAVMHHTCGAVYELIGDMVEAGLDVLNPLQPGAAGMDHASIKAQFGPKLCFHGGISIQTNLPFGTPEDVKAEVKEVFETLGGDSGYIACTAHNIQADTSVENVLALFEAYHKYR